MTLNFEYLYPGVMVYRNVFTKETDIINRLENILSNEDSDNQWKQAMTGYAKLDKKYRDCYDFKIKKNTDDPEGKTDSTILLEKIWEDAKQVQIEPVDHYRAIFGIAPLKYWEAFNFIKYGPGQHFDVHSDHGYSYICTLSSVGYLNDDYEGGELFFDKLNLKIKPKAGDLYLFPSSYIYSHAAMPVTSGTKYSIVTMLDYLEAPHTPEYREMEKRYAEGLA
jgi:Rps23 Pro-64 3,4-dihydroxylase Tpa1-like proline 4-hydroxylase